MFLYINGGKNAGCYSNNSNGPLRAETDWQLKRGDYIQVRGEFGVDGDGYHGFQINRI